MLAEILIRAEGVRQHYVVAIVLGIILVRAECVRQRYVVAIALGIISLLSSLFSPRPFLFYQKEGS